MSWLNDKSQISFGKYKGKKVSEIQDAKYIKTLHESKLNVYFTDDVLDRLKIELKENSKRKPNKQAPRNT